MAPIDLDATEAAPDLPPGSSSAPMIQLHRGAQIGRYVVLDNLGAGAMGVVIAAYDPELDRKIAIKLLKPHGGDPEAARVRLQREAQALAKLDHRNVVRVHDVGVHDEQLFISMEFVEGQTLGAWMHGSETPRPWEEVLHVFMDAGRGLAAAHAAGLVHRDFKPENVMLGEQGRVRVMDFGLARAKTEDRPRPPTPRDSTQLLASELTQTGAMMGTPAYMSLEQFLGTGVDARSDQFGFCVALYEALYGERPFPSENIAQLIQAVEDGTIRPSPRGSTVPAWVRRVLERGLRPDAEARWPSMDALLAALAKDPRIRRRRWLAGFTALALFAAAAGAVVASTRAQARSCAGMDERLVGVWDEARRSEVQAGLEGTGLGHAASTWTRVEQALDDYTQRWVRAREQACEATRRGEQSGELLDLRMACLDKRLSHVQATVEVLAQADTSVVDKAVDAVAGLPGLERCADASALRAAQPPPEDPAIAARVVELELELVEVEARSKAGKYQDGLPLAEAVVAGADELGHEPLQVHAWLKLAVLQTETGSYEDAAATLERAYESALGLNMAAEAAHASERLIYVVGVRLARFEQGRRWALDARPLARATGRDEELANYLNTRGILATKEADYEAARTYFEQALEIRTELFGPEHSQVATALGNLGVVAVREGDYEAARPYFERLVELRELRLGPEHPNVASALNNLGALALKEGQLSAAREYFERALSIKEQALGPEHPSLAATLNNLGSVASEKGELDAAQTFFTRALAIRELALGPRHPELGSPLHNLGAVALAKGELGTARTYYERALSIYETLGAEHPKVATALDSLGRVTSSEGDLEAARGYYERALAIREASLGSDHREQAESLTGLGRIDLAAGKPSDALPRLERALQLREEELDASKLGETCFALARALWEVPSGAGQDRERAAELAARAEQAFAGAGDSTTSYQKVQAWRRDRGL